MSLLDTIKTDIEQITTDTDSGFAVDFEMLQENGTPVALKGTTARHHTSFDTDGVKISSRNSHVSVSEQTLIDAGITVRNASGDVALLRRRVNINDSSGQERQYIVAEQYPDETIGLIVLILTIFE